MAGEGFLRQMNDTLKYNRELLRMKRNKPFDKTLVKPSNKTTLDDDLQLSEKDRQAFIRSVQEATMREENRRLKVLIFSVVVTFVLLLAMLPIIKNLLNIFL